jgi:hypothetical protein
MEVRKPLVVVEDHHLLLLLALVALAIQRAIPIQMGLLK